MEPCRRNTTMNTIMDFIDGKFVEVQADEYHLLEMILSSSNMNRAYHRVMANGGSSGVDSMNCNELFDYLNIHRDELRMSILKGCYKPHPVRRIEIPKGNGKMRCLGIPTLVDRLVQQSIVQVLTPIFEPQFCNGSYGFRPGRGAHDALKRALQILNDGFEYAIGIDLERFFDTVNHQFLIRLLSHSIKDVRVTSLINEFLCAGVMVNGEFEPSGEGTPQGGPISPLLSNIVLNEFDKELNKRGLPFVRYADDSLVFCNSMYEATTMCKELTAFISDQLRLKVNCEKTKVGCASEMDFLGYSFSKSGCGWQLEISRKSLIRLNEKLHALADNRDNKFHDKQQESYKQLVRGWINYFTLSAHKPDMENIGAWLHENLKERTNNEG